MTIELSPLLGSPSVAWISVSVFVQVLYCLDAYSFVKQLEFRYCVGPTLVFFFNIPLDNQGLLWFHANVRIVSSSSLKNADGILIGIALDF